MVLILIFPEIPRVLGAYKKLKKRGSFHKNHGAYKNKMSVQFCRFYIRNISLSSEKGVAYKKKSVSTLIFLYNKHVSNERLDVFFIFHKK